MPYRSLTCPNGKLIFCEVVGLRYKCFDMDLGDFFICFIVMIYYILLDCRWLPLEIYKKENKEGKGVNISSQSALIKKIKWLPVPNLLKRKRPDHFAIRSLKSIWFRDCLFCIFLLNKHRFFTYSTVTDLARLRGLSTSNPLATPT